MLGLNSPSSSYPVLARHSSVGLPPNRTCGFTASGSLGSIVSSRGSDRRGTRWSRVKGAVLNQGVLWGLSPHHLLHQPTLGTGILCKASTAKGVIAMTSILPGSDKFQV